MPPEGGRLETIDAGNWRDFVAAPAAVLLIGKTTCPVCQEYARELTGALDDAARWPGVRFGKIEIDRGGQVPHGLISCLTKSRLAQHANHFLPGVLHSDHSPH